MHFSFGNNDEIGRLKRRIKDLEEQNKQLQFLLNDYVAVDRDVLRLGVSKPNPNTNPNILQSNSVKKNNETINLLLKTMKVVEFERSEIDANAIQREPRSSLLLLYSNKNINISLISYSWFVYMNQLADVCVRDIKDVTVLKDKRLVNAMSLCMKFPKLLGIVNMLIFAFEKTHSA